MKLLVWLFAVVSSLLTVLIALLLFIDAEAYRAHIERYASTAFGRNVVLQGPIKLQLSLMPRFVVNGLKIANPKWASRPFLATVDRFDIRVNLLSLLQDAPEIVAVEFHGVDLLLEKSEDGANNFTFEIFGKPEVLPAIKHMGLYDTTVAYAGPTAPVWRLHLAQVKAHRILGRPVVMDALTEINEVPVAVSLLGEPLDHGDPLGPWQIDLHAEAGGQSLQLDAAVSDPTDWRHGAYRLKLEGESLRGLERLSGYALPESAPYQLSAKIEFDGDGQLMINDLVGHVGNSDILGMLRLDKSIQRPQLKIRLASTNLDLQAFSIGDSLLDDTEKSSWEFWDKPLDLGILAAVDLDVELRLQRLQGLEKSLAGVVLGVHADHRRLKLTSSAAVPEETRVKVNTALPWGDRLRQLFPVSPSLKQLLQQAELDIRAQAPETIHRYSTALLGRPLEVSLSSIAVAARPDAAVEITAKAAINNKPVSLKLSGETLAALLERPAGPWHDLVFEAWGDGFHLGAAGSAERPLEAEGLDVSYALSGADLHDLWPISGAYSFSGRVIDHPGRRIFDNLQIRAGKSDVRGRVVIHSDGQRQRLEARLAADQIHVDETRLADDGETSAAAVLDRPLDLGGLSNLDLDLELRVRHFAGLMVPVQDISFNAQATTQALTLAPLQMIVDGVHLEARALLPWGERLAFPNQDGASIRRLLQQADIALKARLPAGKSGYHTKVLGHPVDLELTGFEAIVAPGEAVQVSAAATLNATPVTANLRAEPLAQLLRHPTGPWQDLALEVHKGDIHFQASGAVDQPLEVSGFDLRYALRGAEIKQLLPLFNLILPLEGAYALSGHFSDRPDGVVFDDLAITFGESDISGRVSVFRGNLRPIVEAYLYSKQINLGELLPARENESSVAKADRVIPEYDLPVERMRSIDGKLRFQGKQLQTPAGTLGDISFTAMLKDGVFKVDPFRVRGWAGALIDAQVEIDSTQEPPMNNWRWTARDLDHGVLLKQANFAETVEGQIDITLRLSGTGRNRREFLGNVDGELAIVGREGKFGSRRLDLWGAELVTTMLSRQWRSADVTHLNCLVARIGIKDGIASSDDLLVDTRRITIAAAGTLNLETEELNLVIAPRPKRTSLVSLANPIRLTGTLAKPEVSVTRLPRSRMAAVGTGVLASLVNPGYLIFSFSQIGSRDDNPCVSAIERAMIMKGRADELDSIPAGSPKGFSLLPGCTQSVKSPVQ
jgi:uncharacterized protein involved in outer membrane biogenesis